jgi:nitroreductase
MSHLKLTVDEVLTTTRAVRKRLDFDRPVEYAVIRECLDLAVQSPTGSVGQFWQFVVVDDAEYLAENLGRAPWLLVPLIVGRFDGMNTSATAGAFGSILPAVWSFMLAARERSLGTCWTTIHLMYEREAADILGIPYERYTQVAMVPIAYTKGTEFKAAPRKDLDQFIHRNAW